MTEKDEQDIINETEFPKTSDDAHSQLMNDPKYAVHVHESQLKRIVEVLEEVSQRLVTLEDKFIDLELSVRFKETKRNDGPPEPPSSLSV
jgi:hypothetical protein